MENTSWDKYEKLVLSRLDEYLKMINELYEETQAIRMELIKLEARMTFIVGLGSFIGSSIFSTVIGILMHKLLKG